MRFRDSSIIMGATAFYCTTLIVANVTAGKLFDFGGIAISAGAFAYMAALGTSDVLVDIYGPRIGYKLVVIGSVMNVVVVALYQLVLRLPPISGQQPLQAHFEAVFASSTAVIIGSLLSYPLTESVEVFLWKRLKEGTNRRHMWLRNAAVALSSQLLDATIFFNLAFFIVPAMLYGQPVAPFSGWWQVMMGAWLYGLWKGFFLGTLDYPLMRIAIPFIRKHRIADIPDLEAAVAEEEWAGRW